MKQIFIVDDHPMMRRGYAALIDDAPDLDVFGEAGSAQEALAALAEVEPDLVVADISLDGPNGIELARQLLTWYPDLPILIASMHDEALYATRALQVGARGYIMKTESDSVLLQAIRHVLGGHVYLSTAMQDRLLFQHVGRGARGGDEAGRSRGGLHGLSDRELEVFELIGLGHTAREIAEMLAISPKTVESHRARIKTKLGADTPTELMRRAIQWVETIGGAPRSEA